MLVDRIGAKRVMVPSTLLFGLIFGSLYFLTASLWHFYAICVIIPILAAGTAPLTYSRILVAWFDEKRGLALGIGLAGVGIGTAMVPVIATKIMELYSWREAYAGLGLLIIILAAPVIALVLRNSPREMGLLADGKSTATEDTETAESKC